MIRQIKNNDKNYFVVHTDVHIVDDVNGDVIVPMTVQVNVTSIEPKKQMIVYNKLKSFFDKTVILRSKKQLPPSPPISKKEWWKFWEAK
jgi:predicted AAA+ superfamily ATPase